jgi:hypothetical protein
MASSAVGVDWLRYPATAVRYVKSMDFGWDSAKADTNLANHGIYFDDSMNVFDESAF